MTRYYVTTGTSLSQKSRCWFSEDELAGRCRDRIMTQYDDRSLINVLETEDPDTIESVFATARGRSTRFANKNPDNGLSQNLSPADAILKAVQLAETYFDPTCGDLNKRQTLPAELSTLLTMDVLFGGFSDQDEIYFIGGESNRAEVLMSAAVLRCLSRREQVLVPEASIIADYERELDPLNPTTFFQAMVKLWSQVNPTADKPPTEFVVTGGYNGVGIALAIRIKFESTAFHYLHEDSLVDESKMHGLVTMNVRQGNWE